MRYDTIKFDFFFWQKQAAKNENNVFIKRKKRNSFRPGKWSAQSGCIEVGRRILSETLLSAM